MTFYIILANIDVENIEELLKHTLETSPFGRNNVSGSKVKVDKNVDVFTTA